MAQNNKPKLTGAEKAAVLLMNLGEDLAGEVMMFMTPTEMQIVGSNLVKREKVSLQVGREVISEFMEAMGDGDMAVEGLDYARSLLTKALGEEKAAHILDRITLDVKGEGIESIRLMDPAVVADIISGEHPQIIALIMVHLNPEKAAEILDHLGDERLKGEVMLRVATLSRIPEDAVKDLEDVITEQMMSARTSQGSMVEGVKLAAEIINQLDSSMETGVMEVIEKSSPDLATQIQEKMFVFTDLLEVDDRGIQQIIKEITTDVLTIALKGAEEELRDKFLKNMSERAAEMLVDDMEAKGPVRLSDVEKAQQEIIKVAKRLEQEGTIIRGGKGGEVFV